MKGSQELIAHFNKRETELKEKATKLNMFLEGYALGYSDTKSFIIGKALEVYEKELRRIKRILNEIQDGAGKIISVGGSLIKLRKELEK